MDVLSFLLLLVIGGLAGWAAAKVFKTDKHNTILTYVIIGVVGAVIGKLLIEFVGFEIVGSGVIVDFIVAFVGSVVLVGISKLMAGKILK